MADLSSGACAGLADSTYAEADIFFPEPQRGRPTGDPYTAARAVCSRCSIRDICLQDALTETVQWGFRVMTPEERQALKTGPGKVSRNRLSDAEHIQRRAYYEQHWTDTQIAIAQGVNASTIKGWRAAHNLPSHARRFSPHTPDVIEQKWAMYRAGYSDQQIADALGCGPTGVRKWRNREGLKANGTRTRVSA